MPCGSRLALAPQDPAYHAIWIDGVQLNLDDPDNQEFVDPLYGKTYLPRKFKVAFAIPPVNDIDVFTNDVGFIAIVENDRLVGYNLAGRRRHGPHARQQGDLSAPGERARIYYAGKSGGRRPKPC